MLAPAVEPHSSELITAKSGVTIGESTGNNGRRSVVLQVSRPAVQMVELSTTVQVPGMPPEKSSVSTGVLVVS